jgi:hypothetical protein
MEPSSYAGQGIAVAGDSGKLGGQDSGKLGNQDSGKLPVDPRDETADAKSAQPVDSGEHDVVDVPKAKAKAMRQDVPEVPSQVRTPRRLLGIGINDVTGDALKIAGTTVGFLAIGGAVAQEIISNPSLGLADHGLRWLVAGVTAVGAILGGIAGMFLSVHEVRSRKNRPR